MKFLAFAPLMIAATLAGCGNDAPKCADTATLIVVRDLFAKNTGGNHKATESELGQVLKIDSPRANGYDEKIKKYTCEATVIVDDKVKMPIKYESQRSDNGDHIVSLQKFSFADQGRLSVALYFGLGKLRHSPEQEKPAVPVGGTVNNIVGNWKGNLEGEGNMTVKPAQDGYSVSLDVSAPGCTGSFEGSGTLAANTLKLTKTEDGQTCVLKVEFSDSQATVTEDGCMSYHGAACGFSGSLKKIN